MLRWHRWFGIVAALWIFGLASSGALIVFHAPFDRWLNADLLTAKVDGSPLPFSRLFELAERARPDSRVISVALDRMPGSSAMALLGSVPGKAETPAGTQLFIDPYSGRVLGERVFGRPRLDRHHLPSMIYQFHVDWLLGPWVTYLLGFVALFWIADHVIGAVLATTSAKSWADSFRVRWQAGGHKRTFDLHRAGGLWIFPVTFMLALTGLPLVWYPQVSAVIAAMSPLTPMPTQLVTPAHAAASGPKLNIDVAVAAARARYGLATVGAVADYPDQGIYWISLYDPRDLDSFPARWITVNRATGQIIQDRHSSAGSAGDTVTAWELPLHSGKVFGWPGRIVVFLTGILLCTMVVTGLMIWRRKVNARQGRGALKVRAEHQSRPR